ncbi:amidase signature domain-containing protein [Ilyonectria robusta]|uniref:amidase signature domain-containing protein n=1 Tax=Ilyonectria robusta TaxID=1079257 RepID=UPI001E8D5D17|nr:amidase signature domain-containing protein [Ilyonectria robusta]KAH8721721.1 amidase signature domain-containing protein [Ilyonectria robusta]
MASVDWQKLIEAKLADRDSRIRPEWRLDERITMQVNHHSTLSAFDLLDQTTFFTEREREITEKHDASTLIQMMATGAISSVEVTTALCKRAAIAQQLTNCLTEIFFDNALQRAHECDEFLAREGRPMGPLHGMPISIKDTLMVKGEAATLGFVSYLVKPVADENSVLVNMLLEAGAVLYCKTNVPQTLFMTEGMNNVFGYTMNPHKLCLTPGGSSSGEGALVGFRGSLLGVGSDIGGSIRLPSIWCGAFGFKPTANRIPYSGQQDLIPKGSPGVTPALGPHAQSAKDLTLFSKTIIQAQPWKRDPAALCIPWRDIPTKDKLNIGVWVTNPDLPVSLQVTRTLHTAVADLEAAGHQITPIEFPLSLMQVAKTFLKSTKLDPNNSIFKLLADGGEQPLPALLNTAASVPTEQREYTLKDVWDFNRERDDYRKVWHKVWAESNIDVLLCPAARFPAVAHGKVGAPWHTMVWNLLDCPASVIPFLTADNATDPQIIEGYDPELSQGAPCGLQVVGWTGQDEEVLMATEVISEALESGSAAHL